jgi:hypothetical protein
VAYQCHEDATPQASSEEENGKEKVNEDLTGRYSY